jgi:hypothetical protein
MIYEGHQHHPVADLLGRKVLSNNGATLRKFGKLVAQLVAEEGVNERWPSSSIPSPTWVTR